MGRRFVVHRLPTHQSLNVFLPARVVQEVVRERGSVVGTAVFAAWGVAVNGVCVDVVKRPGFSSASFTALC